MGSSWLLLLLVVGTALAYTIKDNSAIGHGQDDDNGDQDDDHDDDNDECQDDDDDDDEDVEQSHRLDRLTHDLVALEDYLAHPILSMQDATEDLEDLSHRLDDLEHHGCKHYKEFQCGGDEPHCISSLLMCDGENDCKSHLDEADHHCHVLTSAGSRWIGKVVYDHCTQRRPDKIEMDFSDVHTVSYFPARPQVQGNLLIERHTDEYDEVTNLPVHGYWNPAERAVVLFPPESDNLGLVCEFHGHDHDTCVGKIIRQSTHEPCAEFTFHKVSETAHA